MNPNAFWASVLRGIYFPNTTFLQAARGSHASAVWISLLHGSILLVKGIRKQVQDGVNTNFREDPWIPSLPHFKIGSTKPANCMIECVADVILPRGVWDKQKISSVVTKEELEAITSISLPLGRRNDIMIWHFTQNGAYTVKSGYQLAYEAYLRQQTDKPESSFKPKEGFWKSVWKLKVPNKIRNFWWRVCKNAVATKENLFRRRCAKSSSCPLCDEKVESIEHLLFACPWTRAVWFGCNVRLNGDRGSPESALRWTSEVFDSLGSKEAVTFLSKVALISWFIWKARNEAIFRRGGSQPFGNNCKG